MRFAASALFIGVATASCVGPPTRRVVLAPTLPARVRDIPAKLGQPYAIAGTRYVPTDDRSYRETGLASWYGDELRGARTANGEIFNPDALTAAHRTLPIPSYLALTSLDTGKRIVVRVNDRGPFHGDRILDMSFAAARALGMTGHGARPISVVRVFPPAAIRAAVDAGRLVTPPADGPALATLRRQADWMPAPAPSQAAQGEGPFWLQVATFSSYDRAHSMATRLRGMIDERGGLYRVRLGPYENAAAANGALAPLAASGYPDASIVR